MLLNFSLCIENKDLQGLKQIVVTLPQKDRNKALLRSAETSYMEGIEVLLQYKADIDSQDEAKRTALHLSIIGKASDIALYLIKKGAKVDLTDSFGRTPLHYAARNNDLPVTKKLIKVNYKRTSVLTSWKHFINIFKHILNASNLLHPIKAYNGYKLKYCFEYVNKNDVLGNNAFKYVLGIEDSDPFNIQIYLLNHGAVPEAKLNLIESAALVGLQMFLGQTIINGGIKLTFNALNYVAGGIDSIIAPYIPKPPLIDDSIPPIDPVVYRGTAPTYEQLRYTLPGEAPLNAVKKMYSYVQPITNETIGHITTSVQSLTNAQINKTFAPRITI